MKKLSIVILNWNKCNLLEDTLDSLMPYVEKSKGVDVVVVDNGSTDGSVEYLKKKTSPRITSLFNKKNLGFVGGNNKGVKFSLEKGYQYIMLLNNDVLVKDKFWESMIKFMEDNKRVGVVGPKIYFAPGYEFHKSRYQKKDLGKVIWYAGGKIDWQNVYGVHLGVDEVDVGQWNKTAEVDFVSGCCLMARAKVWQENLLDEKLYLYYEDSDFCVKAKKRGWGVYYHPTSSIWHINAGSSVSGGTLQDYFITRNRLLFGMRWAPLRTKMALIKESFKLLSTGRVWQKKGVLDFYMGRFGRGSWQ